MALKLANFVYLKEKKNTWPILLLDDLFDKLDAQRVDALAGLLKSFDGAQVFITDTSRERLQAILDGYAFPEIQYYSVEQGKVS
jgi:DNA replication and repair protein RecF